jgi:hypothetical protein
MGLDDSAGQDQFKPVSAAPTDCRVSDKPTNHRAGYGSVDERTAWLLDWCTRHPHTTLASGEPALLLRYIRRLEDRIRELEA